MRPVCRSIGLLAALGIALLWPAAALADGGMPAGWPGWHLQAAFLGLLAPLALILLAVGATPPEEALDTMAAALMALVAGTIAYMACGFGFQFGGLFLQVNWPGLRGLAAEWSPFDPSLGLGWGVIGLRGFFLGGEAATPDAYALAMAQLPAVGVAVLIPTLALVRRVGRGMLAGLAALVGGLLFPTMGNWVWGGGWLALLGLNTGWGHGYVDVGGSGWVHVLGAGVALAGLVFAGRNRPVRRSAHIVDLPPVYFPLFVLTGALLAPVGWLGLVLANPLLPADLAPGLAAVSLVLAALGGAAPGLAYSWLATGRADAQLAARGLLAGMVAGGAGLGLMPPFAALVAGLVAGVALPVCLYAVEHTLRWHDPNAILVTHGVPGVLGALWLALVADGRYGVGWNGVYPPLGLPQQGVAGLVVAPGLVPGVPGQLWAQLAGLGAALVLGLGASLLAFSLVWVARRLPRLLAPAPRRARARSGRR